MCPWVNRSAGWQRTFGEGEPKDGRKTELPPGPLYRTVTNTDVRQWDGGVSLGPSQEVGETSRDEEGKKSPSSTLRGQKSLWSTGVSGLPCP